MAKKRKHRGWNLKKYNQYFNYDNKRWEVIHKDHRFVFAVEIDKKGIAGGPVERFPQKYLELQK